MEDTATAKASEEKVVLVGGTNLGKQFVYFCQVGRAL
jgi:hypothetical protein